MKNRSRIAGAAMGLLAGCQDPAAIPDPAPLVWSGEWIEIATHGQVLECGGSRAFLDRFAGAVAQEQGLELDEPPRIYLLTPDELRDLGFCPPGTTCAYDRFVYTDAALDKHELVHALRGAAFGASLPGPSLLEEGLATLYGGQRGRVDEIDRDVYAGLTSAADGLRGQMPTTDWYPVGADFLGFLARDSSYPDVVSFVDELEDATTVDDVAERFEAHYGVTMDSAITEFREDYPACTRTSRTRFLLECAEEPTPFDNGHMEPTFDLECGAETTLGPLDGEMWTTFTFEVDEATELRFRAPLANGGDLADACPGTKLDVFDCDRGCLADPDLYVPWWSGANGPPSFVDETRAFGPGRYLVRLSRDVDDPGPVCVSIETED